MEKKQDTGTGKSESLKMVKHRISAALGSVQRGHKFTTALLKWTGLETAWKHKAMRRTVFVFTLSMCVFAFRQTQARAACLLSMSVFSMLPLSISCLIFFFFFTFLTSYTEDVRYH